MGREDFANKQVGVLCIYNNDEHIMVHSSSMNNLIPLVQAQNTIERSRLLLTEAPNKK